MTRRAYLGEDSVHYAENQEGYVYITTPQSALREGFTHKVAETVPDVEAFWKKMDAQERAAASQMNERLYQLRKDRMDILRRKLNTRAEQADCTAMERDVIRESLKVLDRKEEILMRNSIYGVAEMQMREAPLPAPATKVDTAVTIEPKAVTESVNESVTESVNEDVTDDGA